MRTRVWVVIGMSLWLITGNVLACGMGKRSVEGYEVATLSHAHDHWLQGSRSPIPFVFIDVRTPAEYRSGHIPGAINIPVDTLAMRLGEVPHDKQVYLYCEGGVRAARAGKLLAARGYTNIEVVPASMRGWRDAGFPVNKGGRP
ncbi:MAG: rhodanese-like domain-containing protein [Zetaproteobacteria bacterium]|nr:MAG: rhodanese-like domain-containing protein [Zetaproteobacteria bacterium]